MVGFAVVGLGMGRVRARLISETDGADLRLVVDLNAELARTVGEELNCPWSTDAAEAYGRDDVDVVMMMTPSGLHAKLGVEAIAAGKHLIVTKPMDVTTAACDELIDAADAAGLKLGVDYQSRYVDANLRLAEAMRRGWLGRPILGEARFKWYRAQSYYDAGDGWRGTWAMDGGGSLANQGAHNCDLLLWFMGEPTRVYAETAVLNHDIETEDLGLVILNFESGARGTILATTTFPASDYHSVEVHGSEGGVILEDSLAGKYRTVGDGLQEKMEGVVNEVHNAIEDMVQALETDGQMRVDGREGRRTVALLEAIYSSAGSGKPIALQAQG